MHDNHNAQRGTNRIAVLVDTDNVSPRHADAIFTEIAKHGEAILKRAYGDFASPSSKGWTDKLSRHGLVPMHSVAGAKGKNSTDISMAIDAMDLLWSRIYDAFFIISSDSDFTRLVQRLREGGAEVYCIGERKTPESLRKSCRRFFLIENLARDQEAEQASEPELALPNLDPVSNQRPVAEALPIIIQAYERLKPDHGDGWVPLRKCGQVISNVHPDFDPRTFGIERLGDLAVKTGRFQIRQVDGRGWWMREKIDTQSRPVDQRHGSRDGVQKTIGRSVQTSATQRNQTKPEQAQRPRRNPPAKAAPK